MDHPWLSAPAAEIAQTARTLLGWEVSANGVMPRRKGARFPRGEDVRVTWRASAVESPESAFLVA
ncbi:hypothetical protein [Micromonospora sp. DT229]|uniref:hypothetical protein n=1 Tax=Micromonospora sp. DT229 TaxID=3393430 RepID=UPI003CF9EEE8